MTAAPRILIVDDECNIRLALRTTLQATGAVVDEAADGASAIRCFEQSSFQAAIVDLRMPGMDGLEALRRIRERWPTVPVVIVTAHGTVDAAVDAMKLGAYDFLQKPFDPQQIRDVVRRMLRGEPPTHAGSLPPTATEFDALIAAGQSAVRQGRLDAAMQFARRAIALLPDRPEAYHVLGTVNDVGRDRLRAQVFYRTALAFDPTYTPSDRNLDRLVAGGTEPMLFGDEPRPPRRRS
ncbi:MAG: response regulator [Planctomycetes bacterium]|nr:response regulator [Planctomycetota bacterium]